MGTTVHMLSGGAAQGLTDALAAEMSALGVDLQARFGAVGVMLEQLNAGVPCDVFISTQAMLQGLAEQGRMQSLGIAPLGWVATGVAAKDGRKAGRAAPAVGDEAALRTALLAAAELHCPDTVRSTAGIHVAKVLHQLGLTQAMASRMREHPNGMTAMRALAASAEPSALGCTQITEILATPGVHYAGDLPGALGLKTLYCGGVLNGAAHREAAVQVLELLVGSGQAALRVRCGFAP